MGGRGGKGMGKSEGDVEGEGKRVGMKRDASVVRVLRLGLAKEFARVSV